MSQSRELEFILQNALQQHEFSAAVVATVEGLALSSARKEGSVFSTSEILAAVAPLIRRAARQSVRHYGLQPPDEAIVQAGNQRMVCRFFNINEQPLILIVVVPKRKAYRQAMNRIIRDMRQLLQK